MSFLPQSTNLGKLEMLEVYHYYDQPVFFSCQNASGRIFLAVWADEDDDFDTWLYVPMSKLRFQHVRSGAIDLHQAFAQAEDDIIIELTITHQPHHIAVRRLPTHSVDPDWFPLPGEFLELETETLPALESIEQKAQQSNREFVKFSLGLLDQRRTEAPAYVLGRILQRFQLLVNAIGASLVDQGRITLGIRTQMELAVVNVGAGSFEVELASSQLVDLFGESQLGNAISQFIDLLNIGDDHQLLQHKIAELKRPVALKYLEFLKSLSGVTLDTYFHWASPNEERGKSGHISSLVVQSIIETIKELEDVSEQDHHIIGRLVMADSDRMKFRIVSGNNDIYSGDISDEVFQDLNITIGKRYHVTLREIHQRKIISRHSVTKYLLLALTPHFQPD